MTATGEVVAALARCSHTVAVAESLTGGLVCSLLVDVPGVSSVLRGGVVAYATDLKHVMLGVDADLLERAGPVAPDVASQMAEGVRRRLDATWGLATTGVAGPDPQGGVRPGTAFVAVSGPGVDQVRALHAGGGRAAVRQEVARAAIRLLQEVLADVVGDVDPGRLPGPRRNTRGGPGVTPV